MDSGDEGQPTKKRRVTKACDQCRKRRIKCESYPNVALDHPCVICTEAGTAAQCTYTRPTKKRGPQAGKAKAMEEKVATFERLIGYLLVNIPNFSTYVEAFAAASQTSSSPTASTSASTSSTAAACTPEQYQAAYTTSSISELLDSLLPPPAAPTAVAGKDSKIPKIEHLSPPPPALPIPPTPSTSSSALPPYPLPQPPSMGGRKIAPLPYGSTSPSFVAAQLPAAPSPSAALDALAAAASNGGPSADAKGKQRDSDPLAIPTLPGESVRNLLLDLYFNQVVHPHYPMLDKSRFLRWSAHLPSNPTSTTTPSSSSSSIPPSLYLSVFALSTSYLPPSLNTARATHPPEVWAKAARTHLMEEVLAGGEAVEGGAEGTDLGKGRVGVETVQAAVLCALWDWGAGEMDRAWNLSNLSLSLSISLSLQLSSTHAPDPSSLKLKTFHSALILHTLLALRLNRPPLIVLEDYDIPIPPDDGPENFELWRSEKTVGELREEWAEGSEGSGCGGAGNGEGGAGGGGGGRMTQAVRSATLSTFAATASLCAIGVAILRWDVCPRRGNGQGLVSGETERMELIEGLKGWEADVGIELRLGEGGGVERLGERARWTVEMQMLVASLYLRLRPHHSYSSSVLDPVPQSLGLLNHILTRYRDLFTLYRSLPTIDAVLHSLSVTLFQQNDYAPHQHDTVLKAYEELGRVFPLARRSWKALAGRVDEHKRELGLLRGIHPTASTHASPPAGTPAPAPIAEPFQSFLSYADNLPPTTSATTVLDFATWDQTDLLVSLGLVMHPAAASTTTAGENATGTGTPPFVEGVAGAAAHSNSLPMPPVIPSTLNPPPLSANPVPPPPPQLQQTPAPAMAISPPTSEPAAINLTPHLPQLPHPPPQQHFPPTFPFPPAAFSSPSHPFPPPAATSPGLFPPHPHPAAYVDPLNPYASLSFPPAMGAPLFDDTNFSALPGDWPSTDMVTRWMDRGSVWGGLEGLGGLGGEGGGTGGEGVPPGGSGSGAGGGVGAGGAGG